MFPSNTDKREPGNQVLRSLGHLRRLLLVHEVCPASGVGGGGRSLILLNDPGEDSLQFAVPTSVE